MHLNNSMDVNNASIDIKNDANEDNTNINIQKSRNTNINEDLIKSLKAFRLQISRAENIKPYFVFSDKQMMGLINRIPKNKAELKEVSGFGDIKIEKYGDALLKIINE